MWFFVYINDGGCTNLQNPLSKIMIHISQLLSLQR